VRGFRGAQRLEQGTIGVIFDARLLLYVLCCVVFYCFVLCCIAVLFCIVVLCVISSTSFLFYSSS
jgi:hypothetical protein